MNHYTYQRRRWSLVLLCSSSAVRRHGSREMNCWTHLDARSKSDSPRYRIKRWKIILGHLSPRNNIALSTYLVVFPLKAFPIPPDTTTAAISAAGIFNDSTKPRALWPKVGHPVVEPLENVLLGPLSFISLIRTHSLSYKPHHPSSFISSSFETSCL